MSVSLGLVGLPNVGKTTVFNALTVSSAPAHSYPFCTIQRNVAVVPVPDARLDGLARVLEPEEVKPTSIEVIDIAGLVRGAHAGEGLGNRFLDDIRNVDALLHIVRCFRAPGVARAGGSTDPVSDLDLVDTELLLADLEVAGRRVDQLAKKAKAASPGTFRELELFRGVVDQLQAGRPPRLDELSPEDRSMVEQERFLSLKPCVVVANIDEDGLDPESEDLGSLQEHAVPRHVVALSAGIEADLVGVAPEERSAYFREFGLGASRVPELLRAGFELLGLITFYTMARNKLHAWRIRRGATAVEAAGLIHSDMAEGFIRADVFTADELMSCGSVPAVRGAGKLRSEGREYRICDGDVLYIHFQPAHRSHGGG